jgi:hypothetical protein
MSTHIVGYVKADDKWNKMKDVWDICRLAGIDPPTEVFEFFDHSYPGDAPGMEVELKSPGIAKWSDDFREGFEVNLELIPKDVKFLRFFNSY